jgi:hypothetical protein
VVDHLDGNQGLVLPRQRLAVVVCHEHHGVHLGGVVPDGAHVREGRQDPSALEHALELFALVVVEAEGIEQVVTELHPGDSLPGEVRRRVAHAQDQLAVEGGAVARETVGVEHLGPRVGRLEDVEEVRHELVGA